MINFDRVEKTLKTIGTKFGINKNTGVIDKCGLVGCGVCRFQHGDCSANKGKWICEEVTEDKLPEDIVVDTPVYVSNEGMRWYRRYFAEKNSDGTVKVFCNGATSWSGDGETETWEKAILAVIAND